MKQFLGLAAVALLFIGCSQEPSDPEVVAVYDGGAISRQDVLAAVVTPADPNAEGSWFDACREAASEIALRRILIGDSPTVDLLSEQSRREYGAMERRILVDLWVEQQQGQMDQVSQDEIEEYFSANVDRFSRAERRMVWNLYRRAETEDERYQTRTLIEDIAVQYGRGVPFPNLVRRYSQSETRLQDGRLGWVEKGRLPAAVEEEIFSVDQNNMTEAVVLPGGLAVFVVSQILPARDFTIDDVRGPMTWLLSERRRFARLASAVENAEIPLGSMILDDDVVASTLLIASPDEPVIEIAGNVVTAKEILEALNDQVARNMALPPLLIEVSEYYQSLVDERILWLSAEPALKEKPDGLPAAIEDHLQAALEGLLYRDKVNAALVAGVVDRTEEVHDFFERNRFLYQSPMRFKLEVLSVPVGNNPHRRLKQLETRLKGVESGDGNLGAVAAELGGLLTPLGWQNVDQMQHINAKLLGAVRDLDGLGFTVPVQFNHKIHVAVVLERDEPRSVDFEQAGDRVAEDYLVRNEQMLFAEVRRQVLRNAGFKVFDERLRLQVGNELD